MSDLVSVLDDRNCIGDGKAAGLYGYQRAAHLGRHHYFVQNCAGLLNGAEHIAAGELISYLGNGSELPLLFTVKRRDINTSADGGAYALSDFGQWSLNTVIDIFQHTRSELNGHRHTGAFNYRSGTDTRGLLINLNGGHVSGHIQDFSDKSLGADTDDIGYVGVSQALCDH